MELEDIILKRRVKWENFDFQISKRNIKLQLSIQCQIGIRTETFFYREKSHLCF